MHRIGNAAATDDERRQSDQCEELRQAIDVSGKLRRDVRPRAHFPTGIREGAIRCVDQPRDVAIRCDASATRRSEVYAIDPAHQCAWLQQAACTQSLLRKDHARTEADAAGELIWLALEECTQFESCCSDLDAIADLHIE